MGRKKVREGSGREWGIIWGCGSSDQNQNGAPLMVTKGSVFPQLRSYLPASSCVQSQWSDDGQGPQLLIPCFCTLSPPPLALIKVWSFIQQFFAECLYMCQALSEQARQGLCPYGAYTPRGLGQIINNQQIDKQEHS